MNTLNKLVVMTLTTISLSTFANSGLSDNASAASKHSALAASHATVATAQVGSAVVAVPLVVVGKVGTASLHAGEKLMNNATGSQSLEITDKTITAGPSPKNMMKKTKNEDTL